LQVALGLQEQEVPPLTMLQRSRPNEARPAQNDADAPGRGKQHEAGLDPSALASAGDASIAASLLVLASAGEASAGDASIAASVIAASGCASGCASGLASTAGTGGEHAVTKKHRERSERSFIEWPFSEERKKTNTMR
jgi:hypothetical protein